MAPSLKVIPAGAGCTFDSVLSGDEYDVPDDLSGVGPKPVILDIGCNVGAFTVWALERWPGAFVEAYEPNPKAREYAEQNLADVCNYALHPVGVGAFDGKAPLFLGVTNLGAASLKRWTGETGEDCGIVNVVHARHLPPADIIKIDTEGCERDILENYPHLAKAKMVVYEWHSRADRDYLLKFMVAQGFTAYSEHLYGVERGVMKWFRKKTPHLYIAVLAGGGQTFVEHESSMRALMKATPDAGITLTVSKDMGTGVDRARNRQAAAALADSSVTHLMFIDADIIFDPQWVINMVRMNMDVVGAAYPRKQTDWNLVEAAVKRGIPAVELGQHATSFIFNHVVDEAGQPNGRIVQGVGDFLEVEELGTGFLMFRRDVLEKMRDVGAATPYITDYEPRDVVHHMFFSCQRDPRCRLEAARRAVLEAAGQPEETFDISHVTHAVFELRAALARGKESLGRYLTEDYAACRWARLLGYKVYLYLDASVKHIGYTVFEGAAKYNFKKVEEKVDDPGS